jgi:hypothetical protein
MNKTLWWFIPLFFLMTVEYRIDLGFFSFAIAEPFVVLSAALVILPKLIRREPLQWRNPAFLLFAGVTIWAMMIRPFSPDWRHGLSDIRDWMVPTLFLFTLLNVTSVPIQGWLSGLVIVLLFNSTVGIFQHFTDGFRPFASTGTGFKTTLDGTDHANFALGFFDAPNGYGMYLTAAIPFMWAWLRSNGQRLGWVRYGLIVLPFLALFYSYARTSMLVIGIIIVLLVLEWLIRSTALLTQVATWVFAGGTVLVGIALSVLPHVTLRTIWWRVALWEIAGITLSQYPMIWLFGNGIDRFIPLSFYPQPHSLFVFMLLEYGVIGIVFTIAIIGWLLFSGLRARVQGYFTLQPALAPMWLGVLGIFMIAVTETIWISVNGRLMFATLFGLYTMYLAQTNPALVQLPRWKLPRMVPAPELPREQPS